MSEQERLKIWMDLVLEAMKFQCEALNEMNKHLSVIRALTEQENEPDPYDEPDPFQTLNGPRL